MNLERRISPSDVLHVAKLARLKLSDEELERFTTQLCDVLDYASEIDSLDTGEVEPTSHPYPLVNVMRKDEAAPTLSAEEALSQAPAAEEGQFRVPPILMRPTRPDRTDAPDRPDVPDRPDGPARPDAPVRPDRSNRPDRPASPARPDAPDRLDGSARPDVADAPDRLDGSARSDAAGESV